MTSAAHADLRELVALGCRILAREGLAETTLGHISARVPDDPERILVRARGADERGLRFTTVDDVVAVDIDGRPLAGEPALALPLELPIHLALLRARPEVGAVVHAHPPDVVVCTVAAIPLRPLVGAYNPPAMWLATRGIPTYDYAGLIRDEARAQGMVAAMAGTPACLLRGHGLTTCGASVQQAVLTALDVQALARINLAVAATGRPATEVTDDDRLDLPEDTGSYPEQLWRHLHAKVDRLEG